MNERTTPESCARVRDRLARLVDGVLSPLDEARDRGHLEACATCRAELATWERMFVALGPDSGDPGAADDLAWALEGLDERLDAARRPGPILRPLQRAAQEPWGSAVGLAAAGLLAMLLLQQTELAESGRAVARAMSGEVSASDLTDAPRWLPRFDGWPGTDEPAGGER